MDYEIPSFDFTTGDWKQSGSCSEIDDALVDELFFPARGNNGRAARALCARCPVRDACLRHALEEPEEFGIWGGTSERERRVLRRERASERLAS